MSPDIASCLTQPHYPVRRQYDVGVTMRDGVRLSIDIYRPDAEGEFPAILVRTPYDNDGFGEPGTWWAQRGYVFAVQDARGRYDSDGQFLAWNTEGQDGYDTIEWLAAQPWCNGKVGMTGSSYLGIVQWMAAPLRPPHLVALMPMVCPSDYYDSPNYTGGAFQLSLCQTWGFTMHARTRHDVSQCDWQSLWRTLPVSASPAAAGVDAPFFDEWLEHPARDDYWDAVNHEEQYGDITVPIFNVGGWYDLYSKGTLTNFAGMVARGGSETARRSQKVLIGPWPHPVGGAVQPGNWNFGEVSRVDIRSLEHRWFDHHLKGIDTGILSEPPVRIFVMGDDNWRDEHEWPLARTDWQPWYLHSGGRANSMYGDGALSPALPGDEPADGFTYDPGDPVPTLGGNNCCNPEILPWGIADQRPIERRDDVLCFTSAALAEDIEVTGPVKARLFISTSARDTDFTAKLIDVQPNGFARNLCEGIFRARYHKSFREPALLEPGEVYELEIDLWVTSNVFKAGHRIRLDISSSNFPRFDRNLNTGGPIGRESEYVIARQTVYHDVERPSHVVLPVIPNSA